MNFSKKEPIKQCYGTMGHDKQNPMALKRKMIDPSGNVCWVSLATGATITMLEMSPYGMVILAERHKKGWVDYEDERFDNGVNREEFIKARQSGQTEKNADFKHDGLTDNEKYLQQLVALEKAKQENASATIADVFAKEKTGGKPRR